MRIVLAVVLAASALAARGQDAATLYADLCSGCHTIGQGASAGPDLIAATKWPHAQLEAAIRRMEANVGPLTDEQIDLLVTHLASAAPKPPPPPAKHGNALNGKLLFFGDKHFANGGSPCFACHAMSGSGGNLAKDLASVRMTEAMITNPPIPMMKSAYARHPVTPDEALDLVAFAGSRQAAAPPARDLPAVRIGAVSFAGVVLGGVALIFRSRKAGVRARLTNKR